MNAIFVLFIFCFLFSCFLQFLWEYSFFTMLCQFLLYSKVNQEYIPSYTYMPSFWDTSSYTYIPSFLDFLKHLGHHRALSRVPCAIQQVLNSYLFYTYYQQCICVNPNLPIHPTNVFPPCIYTYVCEHHFWKEFVSTKMIITHRDIIHPYYQYIHQSETTPTLKTKRYPIGKSTDIYSSQPPSTSCKKIYGPIKLFSSHRIV